MNGALFLQFWYNSPPKYWSMSIPRLLTIPLRKNMEPLVFSLQNLDRIVSDIENVQV